MFYLWGKHGFFFFFSIPNGLFTHKKTHVSPINETYFTNILLQNIFNIKIWHWLFKQNLIFKCYVK